MTESERIKKRNEAQDKRDRERRRSWDDDISNPSNPLSPLNPANPASPLFPHIGGDL